MLLCAVALELRSCGLAEAPLEAVYDRYAQLCDTNDRRRLHFAAFQRWVDKLGAWKVCADKIPQTAL